MLLSMTGHGDAQTRDEGIVVSVEVRTVNNRYFKLAVRADERYAALESQIEDIVRRFVRRGTVQVDVRIEREPSPDDYRLNEVVLASYLQQLQNLNAHLKLAVVPEIQWLFALPGVVDERSRLGSRGEREWPLIERTLVKALENLDRMRGDEGRSMEDDLRSNLAGVQAELKAIQAVAPQIAETYRTRLLDRVRRITAEYDVAVQAGDIVREVALFADRSDISEEIVRLQSHLAQFDQFVADGESSGRKLEFLTQEMFREINTIGSKANDAQIARRVIEVKAAIERMREMIQNIE